MNLDPRRLEALQLPISVVSDALAAANLDLPGGTITAGGKDVVLRTKGEFTSIDEIGNVILRSTAGSTVRLRDVAEVVDGYEDRTTTTRLNGVDAVSFAVRKQAGGNTVAITDRINAVLAKNAAAFPDLTIKPIHEDARFIRSNLEDVRLNIVFGGVMAVLIVFVFMRDWRSTLITALALPTSVIATFFFIWAAGFSLNMMTLMAISLVIGILIDDAVVVRENIYRHMEEGEDPMTAARKGTAEIGLAVMATTFTILAVFLPVGIHDRPRRPVLQVVRAHRGVCGRHVAGDRVHARPDVVVAVRALRAAEERVRTRMGRLLERWGQAYDRLDRPYFKVLRWARASSQGRGGRAPRVRGQSLHAVAHRHRVRAQRGPRRVRRDGRSAAGLAFDETVKSVSEVERALLDTPEVRQVFTTVGAAGQMRKSQLRVHTAEGRAGHQARGHQSGSADAPGRSRLRRSRSPIPSSCRGRLRAADQRPCAATT